MSAMTPGQHPHVDLDVLEQVEQLLSPPPAEGRAADRPEPSPPASGAATITHLPAPDARSEERATTHPAAHVPELPLIAKEPVTPLPRRR